MKPRSKRQVLVCQLSERLPRISKKLEPWAFKNCIEHIGYRNKMWTHCLSCGGVWPTTSMKIKTEECPECGRKLRLETTKKQKSRDWARFAVLQVVEDFQVIRYFDINCHMKAKQKPSYYTREIMQHWILPDGNFEIISMQVGGMGLAYDHFGGFMSLKDKRDLWKYNISVYKIHPDMKVQPVYKRNGLTSSKLTNVRPFDLIRQLAKDSKTETLLKSKQFALLNHHLGNDGSGVRRHWNSIKICIRNNYVVKEATTWTDYLDLLCWFGKDIRNAKYVCPVNLKKEHDKLVKKKTEITTRQDLERKKKKAEADQADYSASKGMFFGLVFCDNELQVKVLEHVNEFVQEADVHKHCVFTNEYYKKPDSLVFSATVAGKLVETVEVSLSKMAVLQSRGLRNTATEYNSKIVELVNKHIHLIRDRYVSKKDKAA